MLVVAVSHGADLTFLMSEVALAPVVQGYVPGLSPAHAYSLRPGLAVARVLFHCPAKVVERQSHVYGRKA